MIHTGLPYDIKEMEKIAEEGAIVDMNQLNFPGIEGLKENIDTSFIFLRNTGFPVTLDYTKCDYEKKEQYLLSYLQTNIENDQEILDTTWLAICSRYVQMKNDFESILSDKECNDFIVAHKTFVHNVTRYTKSIPIFALYMVSLDNKEISLADIECIKEAPARKNINNLFFADRLGSLAAHEDNIAPAMYEDVFRKDNYELTDRISSSYLFTVLNGFGIGKPEDWNLIFTKEKEVHE